jgi:predicted HTH transcriptional regulator
MLGIIIAAYQDFANRVQRLITKGLSKPERVKDIIRNTTGKLTKSEIMELCPDISQKTVERSLSSLQKSRDIMKIGGGRYTTYIWNWER